MNGVINRDGHKTEPNNSSSTVVSNQLEIEMLDLEEFDKLLNALPLRNYFLIASTHSLR